MDKAMTPTERKQKERALKLKQGFVYRGFWVRPSWVRKITDLLEKLK